MKRRMLRILLIAALAGLALSGLYRHFVTNQIMDGGGGMENPDAVREDELQILDGDHTYVDNSALWPVLEGVWESGDGRWQAVIGEDSGIALTLDGETVLRCGLSFTYLQPGRNEQTELYPDSRALRTPDGTEWGEITSLCHEAGDGGSGALAMTLELPEGAEETVTLQKQE